MNGLKMIKHTRNTFWDVTDTAGFQNTTAPGEGERSHIQLCGNYRHDDNVHIDG